MLVVIKGAGDLASGIALRLHHSGFDIAMTEIAAPLSVRRAVSFSRAVYEGRAQVEDVCAVLVRDGEGMKAALENRQIALFVDPSASLAVARLAVAELAARFRPAALVDAIMAKRNTGTAITDAPVVIGVGPGFTAGPAPAPGIDCHAVIETQRGHNLGRVITRGCALPNTGIPGDIGGYTLQRLLRSPADGVFEALASIGDQVRKGDTVALVRTAQDDNHIPLRAEIDGIVRGLLPSGIEVRRGMKTGDIDPRCEQSHCFTVSDKALAVAGGVLEALLSKAGGV